MRIFILLLVFIGFFKLNGQEKISYGDKVVAKMAVHPNCKFIPADQKREQTVCLQKNLWAELNTKLSHYMNFVLPEHVKFIKAKVAFVITKDGKIEQIEVTESSNRGFAAHLSRSMKKLANEIDYIEPAELIDGTKVSFKFVLPVNIMNE